MVMWDGYVMPYVGSRKYTMEMMRIYKWGLHRTLSKDLEVWTYKVSSTNS